MPHATAHPSDGEPHDAGAPSDVRGVRSQTKDATPSPAARVLVALVRLYQGVVSPWLAPRCRFYPSCSAYAVEALRTRGAAVGFVLAVYRVLRCNPWARGGVDHVPVRGQRWASWDGVVEAPTPTTPTTPTTPAPTPEPPGPA
ncbi:membrane protein insertion efficiency factor YidD [Miniimonas sp. S16]|uniref:membrane protein insertion efficiency factor YidD n=1 Tax=Miniimonas sp. S16 TaxID=2171623 RepID=UPI000D526129|nr:membrane protein insertion efficiency factor YidD [Miniimonas sp. S16]